MLRPHTDHRLRITANGRALYEQEWVRYRELYPDVDAVPPRTEDSMAVCS